ncbi:hypothetical protein BGP75_23810 [Motiliproteus sp. MSK22-1]|nr:hypothetical protein BGP75_23810 [Motiliproteus sp. MSK22-1]
MLSVLGFQYTKTPEAQPLQLLQVSGSPLETTQETLTHQNPLIIQSGINSHYFQIEVAGNEAERSVGLMHRKNLAADQGMLFLYQPPRNVNMWMKNTYIALDIIFIGPDGNIIRVAKNTQPHSLELIPSGNEVQAVLEIKSGLTDLLKIKTGDQVQHQLIHQS